MIYNDNCCLWIEKAFKLFFYSYYTKIHCVIDVLKRPLVFSYTQAMPNIYTVIYLPAVKGTPFKMLKVKVANQVWRSGPLK